MSQEKVDNYKKEKLNRKKALKRAKAKRVAARIFGTLVGLVIVFYIGWSVYRHVNPVETTTAYQNAYTSEELSSLLAEQSTSSDVSVEQVTDDETSTEETVATEDTTEEEAQTEAGTEDKAE